MASRRLQNFNSAADDDQAVDLSPMIDMVFLLLIFFLVNANMIVVQMDAKVEVPIAKNSRKQEDKNGRIVINIYKEGTFKNASGSINFDSEEELTDYILKEKEKADGFGYSPVLHLRGDRKAVFRHSRKVIHSSAAAGVDDVKFATYQVNPGY